VIMYKVILLVLLVIAGFTFSGCNTLKGAGQGVVEGAKKDWEAIKKWDKEFREKYW